MNKKIFFLYNFMLLNSCMIYTNLIEIIAEDGTKINISNSMTAHDVFKKCRKEKHCSDHKLALKINDKIIEEGSDASYLPLHSNLGRRISHNTSKATITNFNTVSKKTSLAEKIKSLYKNIDTKESWTIQVIIGFGALYLIHSYS